MRVPRPWFIMIGLVAVIFFAGCGDDDEDCTQPDPAMTVTINATPATPTTGASVALTATVTPAGTGRSYLWKTASGRLVNATAEAATWILPDADGTYEVSLVVGDGTNSATAKKSLVVSDYDPPVDPHFVGAASCDACHGPIHDAWAASGHAGGIETLAEIGVDRNPACLACHTVGYNTTVANGGYDEQAVARLGGVQCENCHTAGSQHPTGGTPKLPIDKEGALCGTCHEGEHHPTFSEWEESGHATLLENPELAEVAIENSNCAKCHNGLRAMDYLNDPVNYQQPADAPTEAMNISCAVCHDPHGNDNTANLRNAVNDVALPNGLHPEAGAGRLCIACHNQRRTPANITQQIHAPTGRLGPHHSNQGDMLAGVGAYDSIAVGFAFASSKHIKIEDGCVSCHNHFIPFEEGSVAYTGHRFEPIVEACQPCHGELEEFTDITAKDDFDGDLAVEGVQDEVLGLLDILEDAIIEATPADSAADRAAIEAAFAEPGWPDLATTLGNKDISTKDQRKATYNWMFVAFDQSKGVHNATYAVQLLQQSILFLNPGKMDHARILVE